MILPGRLTGSAYARPASGRCAEVGARLARSWTDDRSPLVAASSAPRSDGTLGSAACRSTTWSPATTPRCRPAGVSKLTIFILALFLPFLQGSTQAGPPPPFAVRVYPSGARLGKPGGGRVS